MPTRKWIVATLIVLAALTVALIARSSQSPAVHAVDAAILREYAGTYQWDRTAFLYLQIWPELTETNQLVAFDEAGELRVLYPAGSDRFFTGPGAAIPDRLVIDAHPRACRQEAGWPSSCPPPPPTRQQSA
jgi:hypothetical protein